MFRFLIRRLIVAILVIATVLTLVFVLTRLSGERWCKWLPTGGRRTDGGTT